MENAKTNKQFFTTTLLQWYAGHHRPLPWKGEKDPYIIWLSEIILQQTRVEQGLDYFKRFAERFPTVKQLADAPEDEVMKLWEGLGYYSRARNLHFTAKHIANKLGGVFPNSYEKILALKGVGPYTAAAIASFAYNLPYAVLDGNVYRVLARFFDIRQAIDSASGKKHFLQLAQALLDVRRPGVYNQAIMDFGATVCTPKAPLCTDCPMGQNCTAFQNQTVQELPIKEKKIKKRTRFFHYLLLNRNNFITIQKRKQKDIWQNLYEFPLIETSKLIFSVEELRTQTAWKTFLPRQTWAIRGQSRAFKQVLTHQKIIAYFWEIELIDDFNIKNPNYIKVLRQNLNKFAFPKIIDSYLYPKKVK